MHLKVLRYEFLGLTVLLLNIWSSSSHFHEENWRENVIKLLNATAINSSTQLHKSGINGSQKTAKLGSVVKPRRNIKVIEEECSSRIEGDSVCQYRTDKNIRYHARTDKCVTPDDCVTAVVKTAGRYDSLVRLVRSARRTYPKLRFVIIDDHHSNPAGPSSFKDLLRRDKLIYYEQLGSANEGISRGRNVGVARSKTPYIMLLDDDFIFTPHTEISVPLEILMTTNISVVGGSTGSKEFFGITSFHKSDEGFVLKHINNVAYSRIISTNSCLVVDVTENIFVGKRKDILEVGGWNSRLKVSEHLDLFLKLRKHNKLVGFCPEFLISHVPENDNVRMRRANIFLTYKKRFMDAWRISKIVNCQVSQQNTIKC